MRRSCKPLFTLALALVGLAGIGPRLSATELPFTISWVEIPAPAGVTEVQNNNRPFLLPDGNVFIYFNNGHYILDLSSNTWTQTAPAPTEYGTAFLMSDGRVGFQERSSGWPPPPLVRMDIYDPTTNTWTRAADTPEANKAMGTLPDGQTACFTVDDELYMYDPIQDQWIANTEPLIQMDSFWLNRPLQLGPHTALKTKTTESGGHNTLYSVMLLDSLTRTEQPVWSWDVHAGLAWQEQLFDTHMIGCVEEMTSSIPVEYLDLELLRLNVADGILTRLTLPSGVLQQNFSTSFSELSYRPAACAVDAGGRDHLLVVKTFGTGSHPCFAWNDVDETWDSLPPCETGGINTRSAVYWRHSVGLPDGHLFVIDAEDTLLFRRLVATPTSEPIPPSVVLQLQSDTLSINEGGLASFSYSVTGDIPSGGVEVVVERINGGTAPLKVVQNARQLVPNRSTFTTVTIAALLDDNSVDDSGTIRIRVVQADGSLDPLARILTVNVNDTVSGDDGPGGDLPGDVNGDGVVNALDLDEVIDHFGTSAGE